MRNGIINLIFFLFLLLAGSCETPTSGNAEANPFIKQLSLKLDATHYLDYWLILPECFDSTRSYPAVLALPPGNQSISQVEWAVKLYYIRQSIQRNWIVISPAAPEGIKFYEGSETLIPLLLNEVDKKYHIEADKCHLAGVSNGGISAFRLAILYPERFQSVTVFPGVPSEDDKSFLYKLLGMPVSMFVGANDTAEWIEETEETVHTLDSLGVTIEYKKWENNGHVITDLTPAYLFNLLDSYRPAIIP
jgi:predicted peptidase